MDESQKSSESQSFSSSSIDASSSDEEQATAKEPFLSYHDTDRHASGVDPPSSVASSKGATVLRRSLRKIIEESKRDAASSSVSNSRESTPPRRSSSVRRITSGGVSPASSSRAPRLPVNASTRSRQVVVCPGTSRVAKPLDFRRRSTRVRIVKRDVDDDSAKSVPSGSVVSSDDDAASVTVLSKLGNNVSDLTAIAAGSSLASLVDTSDTDSRASSLCAYNTRSALSGCVPKAKLSNTSRTGAAARSKGGYQSRLFECVSDELADNIETDGLRTPCFDSFQDNSSNGSSICSSLPTGELSSNHCADKCKNGDVVFKEAEATFDGHDGAETGTDENRHGLTKLKSISSPTAAAEISVKQEICAHFDDKPAQLQNVNGEVCEFASEEGRKRSATVDTIIETDCDQTSLHNDFETSELDTKTKQGDDADDKPGEAETAKDNDISAVVTCDINKDQDLNEKTKEEVEDIKNVREEPPEILVRVRHLS